MVETDSLPTTSVWKRNQQEEARVVVVSDTLVT